MRLRVVTSNPEPVPKPVTSQRYKFRLGQAEIWRIMLDLTGIVVAVLLITQIVYTNGGQIIGTGLFGTGLSNLWHQLGHAQSYARVVQMNQERLDAEEKLKRSSHPI